MEKTEKWTPIPDFDGYFITDDWRCYSTKKNDYIGSENPCGHFDICLYKGKNGRHTKIHIIIAEIFVPMPDRYKDVPREEMVVHHIDHNPHNNDPSNLQWMTAKEHNELHYNSKITKNRLSKSLRNNPKKSRMVCQIDISSGEIKNIYPSVNEAGRCTNTPFQNIGKVCLGERNKAGGYRWAYLN